MDETGARPVRHATGAQLQAARAYAGTGMLSGTCTTARPDRTTIMTVSSVFERAPEEVFRFCLHKTSFPAIMPDPIRPIWTSTEHGELGGTYDFRWCYAKVVPIRWTAFIDSWQEGRQFSDLQLRGMFRYFHHTHTADPHPDGCRYTDTVVFRSLLGPGPDRGLVLQQMRRLFRRRHARMTLMLDAMP